MRFIILAVVLPFASLAATVEAGLSLEILEGDGAIYNLRSRAFALPRLRVLSADGRAVEGAAVTVRLPDSGPGAAFADGHIAMVTTDEKGEVSLPPMKLNSQLGQWEIRASATYQGRVARTTILQINAAPVEAITPAGKRSRGLYWMAAIAAGAATAATFGLVVSGGSPVRAGAVSASAVHTGPAAAPPLSISAGTGSVSAP